HRLRGSTGAAAIAASAAPVLIGFVVPTLYLLHASVVRVRFAGISALILEEARNTVLLSLAATVLTVVAGLLVAYAARTVRRRLTSVLLALASLGYATPGTVVALGLLPVVTTLDAGLDRA